VEAECVECKTSKWISYDNIKSGKSTRCKTCYANSRKEVPTEYKWLEKRYTAAKQRCTNPKERNYPRYGGRGIEFKFSSAIEYINYAIKLPGFSKDLDIDRINNDGHYEAGNLRWVTRSENNFNKACNIKVFYCGEELHFVDFIKNHTDLSCNWAKKLLDRGYTLEDLVKYKPANKGRRAQNLRLAKLRAE
jgi:hypothetical protein